ncbi:MAG: hypothetical protein P4L36_07060 [Holophaga sp.]|nr:hypothetical protein [Holophaga sp.]
MLFPVRLILVLCAGCGLMGQTMSDLNSLVFQASRYLAHQAEAQKAHPELTLFRIVGTRGGATESLMQNGLDIQQWTLIYQIGSPDAPPRSRDDMQSVSVQCRSGMFNTLVWSPLPVFDAKSLQWVWIAVSLDDAVAELKRLGYTHGFTTLTVMRPMHPRLPDECTFVFKCPPDQVFVGISAQTGRELWTEPFLAAP